MAAYKQTQLVKNPQIANARGYLSYAYFQAQSLLNDWANGDYFGHNPSSGLQMTKTLSEISVGSGLPVTATLNVCPTLS